MKDYPYITFKQLHYFISVAENLSFTKAAKEHFIAQTAMSHNISTLEKELGFTLFERTKRYVALTDAGMVFYKDARKLMDDLEQAVLKAQNVEQGYNGSLRIGFQGIHEREHLPPLLRMFREKYPQIQIELVQKPLNELGAMLEARKLDCIFSLKTDSLTSNAIDELVYATVPICAVLAPDHPLASRKKMKREMLANDPIVFIKPEKSSGTYEAMLADCKKANFVPNIVTTTDNLESTLMLIDAGIGVSFLPKSCKNPQFNIKFIPLDQDNSIQLCLRWHKDTTNQAVALFVNTLKLYIRP